MQKQTLVRYLKPLLMIFIVVGALSAGAAFAADNGETMSNVAKTIDKSISSLVVILVDTALIAGVGFVIASFFKFHQHKLNPTQVPLSQGITLLLIGAGLTLLPVLIPTANRAVFGKNAKIAQIGSGLQSVIGGNSIP